MQITQKEIDSELWKLYDLIKQIKDLDSIIGEMGEGESRDMYIEYILDVIQDYNKLLTSIKGHLTLYLGHTDNLNYRKLLDIISTL